MLSPDCVTFGRLQEGLIQSLRRRVNNGEFTERGLARMIGISQPHMHHVLKGLRSLTPEIGDALIGCMGESLLDLLDVAELGRALLDRSAESRQGIQIPLLAGNLGPGHVCPDPRQVEEWIAAPWAERRPALRPAMMALAPDEALGFEFPQATHALFDLDESARVQPSASDWYLLRIRNTGLLRRVRRQAQTISVLGQMTLSEDTVPGDVMLTGSNVLHYIRGRLLWVGLDPRKVAPLDYAGLWLTADRS